MMTDWPTEMWGMVIESVENIPLYCFTFTAGGKNWFWSKVCRASSYLADRQTDRLENVWFTLQCIAQPMRCNVWPTTTTTITTKTHTHNFRHCCSYKDKQLHTICTQWNFCNFFLVRKIIVQLIPIDKILVKEKILSSRDKNEVSILCQDFPRGKKYEAAPHCPWWKEFCLQFGGLWKPIQIKGGIKKTFCNPHWRKALQLWKLQQNIQPGKSPQNTLLHSFWREEL